MNVHEAAWARHDRDKMTAMPGDSRVTETQIEQPQCSTSQEQDWADIINSCFQTSDASASSNNMDLELLNFSQVPSQFGAVDEVTEHDLVSATTNSSLSSSVCDSASAMHPFHTWPGIPSAQMLSFEDAPPPPPFHLVPWLPEHNLGQPLNFDLQQLGGLGIDIPPTSHPIEAPGAVTFSHAFMNHSTPVNHQGFKQAGGCDYRERDVPQRNDIFGDDEERDEPESADPCYAQLLYQCLKEAPDHTLSLRELYEWVAQHSQKAKDAKNRGWQNSVRHNLSMNAAFARVSHGTNAGTKKGSLWCLTEDALREGVISTTRYRKDPKRKPERRSVPALNRQASGAKGGRATRDATRLRQQQQNRITNVMPSLNRVRRSDRPDHAIQYSSYSRSAEASPQPGVLPNTPTTSPYFLDDPVSLALPLSEPQTPLGQHPMSVTPPQRFQMRFKNGHHKASLLTNFDFLPLDYSQGNIFGDHDPEIYQHPHTPTPSLMTEASFMTDDNLSAQRIPCERQNDHGTFR